MRTGDLLRERRLANGLTQTALARRAGSTQAAISRLERGEVSPSFDTVERLLLVMGEELELHAVRSTAEHDVDRLWALRARAPADRLRLAISWNRLAGEVALAGAEARAGP